MLKALKYSNLGLYFGQVLDEPALNSCLGWVKLELYLAELRKPLAEPEPEPEPKPKPKPKCKLLIQASSFTSLGSAGLKYTPDMFSKERGRTCSEICKSLRD